MIPPADAPQSFKRDAPHRPVPDASQVPEGCVVSYGELAHLAGLGRAARYGRTLSQLPQDTRPPWHRAAPVVG